jgi:YidC/Oxa1 family membrane protein insertase
MEARKREHNLRAGKPAEAGLASANGEIVTESDRRPANRQQPKRQSRSARKGVAGESAATEPAPETNGQKPTPAPTQKKAPAKNTKAPVKNTTAKRQPAQKSAAQRAAAQRAAQKKAAQKKPGSGSPARPQDR